MFFESFLLNFVVALVLIIALTFDYVTKYFSYWYVRHVPYKMAIPFLGSDYHRVLGLRGTTEEVNNLYQRYPQEKLVGAIKSRIPDFIVRDPDLINQVLSTEFESFQSRGLDLDKSRDVCIRNNLFYTDGEKWTLLREGLESILRDMTCVEDGLHDCLPGTNGDVNIQELLSNILDIVFKKLLLGDCDGSIITSMRSAMQKRSVVDKLKSYLKNIFPSIYVLLGLTTITPEPSSETVKSIQQSLIMKHAKSLLQFESKNKNRKPNKPENLAFNIIATFVSEGSIPCVNVLTCLLYELAKDTELQKKARSSEDYLDAVIKETLRLHPPHSIITRKCVKTYKFPELNDDKVLIDRHVTVNIPLEAIQQDTVYYTEAKAFKPERFMNDDTTRHPAYLPFGAGPRRCVGEQLSLQIIRKVAKVILQRFEVEPSKTTPSRLPVVDHNFARVVARDIWLKFKAC